MLGMILGVLVGAVFTTFETGPKLISHWVKPFGTIFINGKTHRNALNIGFFVKGFQILDISKLSQMGGRTIGIYIRHGGGLDRLIRSILLNRGQDSEETRQERC